MRNGRRLLKSMLFTGFLLLSASPAPTALATGAASVLVNGVELSAATPYWKNGGATAPATPPGGGWNAYFNASTATLTLNNALVNNPSVMVGMGTNLALIFADGDLNVVLVGHSSITYTGSNAPGVYGLISSGALSISGSGGASVQLSNSHDEASTYAVGGLTGLTVLSGTLSADAGNGYSGYALFSAGAILLSGGDIQLKTAGENSNAIYMMTGTVTLAGGKITASSETTDKYAAGIYATQVFMEGAEGVFTGYGSGGRFGMAFQINTVTYSGGDYTFIGDTSALGYNSKGTDATTYILNGATVTASRYTDGSSPIQWTSDADGRLTSNLSETSNFRHVRIYTPVNDPPQTGDTAKPWLWAGIAGLCLLLGAGMLGINKNKKRA